ncbi:hypothetical protein Vadar_027052 [Vaccinium darrowii]|uniref:Uncharacterized protein n=1 Tax=Vaccinium darrowii TaxID=229202 RepID=A0ACB7ZM36_9ERIC|nr:hypothetical protein Vadar_027052 [Vaccinium darrowii]
MRIELFISWFFSITALTILWSITIPVHSQCLEDQKSLLLQLKNNLQFDPDYSVKLVSWTQSHNCCLWNGVTCDHFGRVIGFDLNTESIYGGLNHSSSLFSLKFLEKLNLANNNFNSTQIPPSFGVLTNLTYLNLSHTNFVGQIPMEFTRLTRLVKLDLSTYDSIYYDMFPETQRLKIQNPNLFTLIHNLSGLTELYLDGVNISTNGYEWGQAISSALPNLTVLSLRDCNLNGTFQDIIFERVQTLETLDLSNNGLLNGRLPDFPQNLSLRNLVLSGTNFSGYLTESIGNLTELRRIEIQLCNFSGPIPNSLANLSQLVHLDLSRNNFSGPIPNSLANLSQLVHLDFSANNFSGPIPSFQGSKKLTHIDLSSNSLTGVVLSTHFEGLLDLVHIDLSYNSFSGSIPSSLFSLPSLQEIWLYNNKFSGPITGFLNESLSPLVSLDLSSNKLEGPIPAHFFHFLGLNSLSLSFNNFSGNIDLEIFQRFQYLTILDLSYNNLTVNPSVTDSSLSSFPQLWTLQLASCKLQKFPPLMNQSGLSNLDFSNNQISGVIPNWIWNTSGGFVEYLNLSCNLLVGFQPEFRLPPLFHFDLHSNQLQGEIPLLPESAVYLDYSRNNFSSIPAEIGKSIASAFFFSLSDNMLSGPIPPSICNGSHLKFLDLSNNRFSGTIPQCLIDSGSAILSVMDLRNNNLTSNIIGTFAEDCKLRTLDLSGNNLEGDVPKSLANCADAELLNFGTNKINDNFPCFLTNLSRLRVLVLRSNRFHGNINCRGLYNNIWPKLQIIDLALNNFSGILPPEFFSQRKAMMEGGNKGLCGAPVIASCGEKEPTRPTFDGRQEDEINWVYITATLGYAMGFGVIVGPLLYSKRWRQCYYKPVDRVILRILHHRERRARHQKRRDNKN